ncbi:MAG: Asp23/Gls24 family envelope stress response protein [Erysipelotrichaceae bacterium]|jgi:uncharacterized alkaline shock family protein YloU|nr:Asp23/Gls24 family envelope stress response protein [Erysipelotrichaceae bacterium]
MDTKSKQIKSHHKSKKDVKTINVKELIGEIAKITLSCYGVSKLRPRYLFELNKKKINLADCIEVTSRPNKTYHFRVYISIVPHVKLTEVLSEVQKRIKYEIEMAHGVNVRKIDVYVQTIEEK